MQVLHHKKKLVVQNTTPVLYNLILCTACQCLLVTSNEFNLILRNELLGEAAMVNNCRQDKAFPHSMCTRQWLEISSQSKQYRIKQCFPKIVFLCFSQILSNSGRPVESIRGAVNLQRQNKIGQGNLRTKKTLKIPIFDFLLCVMYMASITNLVNSLHCQQCSIPTKL